MGHERLEDQVGKGTRDRDTGDTDGGSDSSLALPPIPRSLSLSMNLTGASRSGLGPTSGSAFEARPRTTADPEFRDYEMERLSVATSLGVDTQRTAGAKPRHVSTGSSDWRSLNSGGIASLLVPNDGDESNRVS